DSRRAILERSGAADECIAACLDGVDRSAGFRSGDVLARDPSRDAGRCAGGPVSGGDWTTVTPHPQQPDSSATGVVGRSDSADAPVSRPWRPPETRPARGFWALLIGSLVVVAALAFLQFLRTPRAGRGRSMGTIAANLPEISSIPDMTLTDQHGRPVNLLRDLAG